MNRAKHIVVYVIVCLFFFIGGVQSSAQPKIPETRTWYSTLEYAQEEKKVEEVVKWLCRTPWGMSASTRAEANFYVLAWLTGTPTVTLNVNTKLLPEIIATEEQLLFSFMHGALLYTIQTKQPDSLTMYCKGLETVAFLAMQSERYAKEKRLRPLLRAYRKNKLKQWVKETMVANVRG